jgi:hypothetical protein
MRTRRAKASESPAETAPESRMRTVDDKEQQPEQRAALRQHLDQCTRDEIPLHQRASHQDWMTQRTNQTRAASRARRSRESRAPTRRAATQSARTRRSRPRSTQCTCGSASSDSVWYCMRGDRPRSPSTTTVTLIGSDDARRRRRRNNDARCRVPPRAWAGAVWLADRELERCGDEADIDDDERIKKKKKKTKKKFGMTDDSSTLASGAHSRRLVEALRARTMSASKLVRRGAPRRAACMAGSVSLACC